MPCQLTIQVNLNINHIERILYEYVKDKYYLEDTNYKETNKELNDKMSIVKGLDGLYYDRLKSNILKLCTIGEGKLEDLMGYIEEEVKKVLRVSGESAFLYKIEEDKEIDPKILGFVKSYSKRLLEMFEQREFARNYLQGW